MPNRNVHEVMGHLGRDPELRIAANGKPVCRLNIATSNSFYDKKTQKWVKQEPDWHNVLVWDKLAEKVSEEFKKGDAIMVRGKGQTREYKDKAGNKRYVTEITAHEVYKPVYVSIVVKAKDEKAEVFEGENEEEADIPF